MARGLQIHSKKRGSDAAARGRRTLGTQLRRNWQYYLLLLPAFAYVLIFCYGPMYGLQIAFKNYKMSLGVWGSPWIGFRNFTDFFGGYYFWTLIRNTFVLSLSTLAFSFPVPILIALLVNELGGRFKRTLQTILYAPHFISTVVLVGMITILFSPSMGIVNTFLNRLGVDSIYFMGDPNFFRPLYIGSDIWQHMGWNAIIYIAAMMNIDPTLYEAAEIDGATRWTKIWRITLPSLMPSIITMLIISVGNIFTVNLDRILLMYNTGTYETADVLQTYVYRIAFQSTGFPDYSYGTAVNLVKSIIAFILVMAVNKIADKVADSRFF